MNFYIGLIFGLIINFTNADICEKKEDNVCVLLDKHIPDLKDDSNNIFMEFYAPWCGHCKALAPEYSKLGQLVDECAKSPDNPNQAICETIKIAKIDATENAAFAKMFAIQSYPTLKLRRNTTQIVDYPNDGGRDAQAMFQWITKKLEPAIKRVETEDQVKALSDINDVVAFAYFKDPDTGSEFVEYTKVAGDWDAIPFLYTTSADLAHAFGIDAKSHPRGLALLRNFENEDNVHHYDGFDGSDLKAFIKKYSMPLVSEFTQEAAPKIFTAEHTKHVLLFENKTAPHHEANMKIFREAAKALQGKLLSVFLDSGDDMNGRILEFFGIAHSDLPTLRIIDLAPEMKKYKPDYEDTHKEKYSGHIIPLQEIVQWGEQFMQGKLKPHLLSQNVPEDWDKSPVKIVVGQNFEQVVMDPKQNVLVEFYAPWCGHCKALEPIYAELGQYFEQHPDLKVTIAKMDSTANEVEGITVSSFPTIKLFPALKEGETVKKPIDFGGERTLDIMKKFVESGGLEYASTGENEEEGDEPYDEDDEQDGGAHHEGHDHSEL